MKYVTTESKSVVQQSVAICKSVKISGQKKKGKNFVPICHFCGVKCYIRPRCFTLINFRENNYKKTNFAKVFSKTHS